MDLVLETAGSDADVREIALEGVRVRGDVRVSLFAKREGDSAHAAMCAAPNVYKAKGLVFLCMFHTAFMTMDEHAESLGRESRTDVLCSSGERAFEVGVDGLDYAVKKVKKGKHRAGSSIRLIYTDDADAAPEPFAESTRACAQATDRGARALAVMSPLHAPVVTVV